MHLRENGSVFFAAGRILISGFGSVAVVWGFFTFPIFWQQSALKKIEQHIIAGDSFKASTLAPLLPILAVVGQGKWDRPSTLSSASAIDLRLLEQAFAENDRTNIDKLMAETGEMIRKSLADSPSDSFLWMVLFWLENTQNGFNRAHLKYLELSYLLGPNEGWIAAKRNRFALAIYSVLPADLAENAVNEFARLVDSRFFFEAADILQGPGWPIRSTLLAGLKDIDEVNRETFGKAIFKLGYDVIVPGVERPDWRPWQ